MFATKQPAQTTQKRRQFADRAWRKMTLERLEDRLTPADITVASLLFRGNLSGTGPVFSSAQGDSIQVGFAPVQGEAFRPLATLTGQTVVDTSAQTLQFKGTAAYQASQGGTVDFWDSSSLSTFNIQNMVSGGESISGKGFPIAGWTYTADTLKFENPDGGSTADSRLATQGTVNFLGLAGLQADVRDTNFVRMAPEGATLTGVSTQVTGGSFKAGGATFNSTALGIGYAPATETFSVYGSAKLSFGANSITATLGDAAKPGLVIASGSITSFSAGLAGSFSLAGGTLGAANLALNYNAPTDTLRLTGSASVAFSDSSGALTLSGAGLVIRAGTIDAFQSTFTGTASLAGAKLSLSKLTASYSSIQQSLSITGAADLAFAGNTASVVLNSQGLVFKSGAVQSFDATLNGKLAVAGAELGFSGISVYYSKADSEFTLSNGKASFLFGDNNASVELGQRAMVVKNGQVESVDATISGDIAVAGASLAVTNLALRYTRQTDEFRMGGAVRMAFDGFDLAASLAADNGLVIKSGALESLNATVTGSVKIAGASVTLTNSAVTYSRADDRMTTTGTLSLAYDKNNFTVALRNDGLVIQGGAISSVDGVANGQISIAGCAAVVDNLAVVYSRSANRLQLTGGAAVTVGESALSFDFLADKGGLVIENGAISSLNANAKGVVVIDGNSVTLDAGVAYNAADSLLECNGAFNLSLTNGNAFSADGLVRIQNSAVTKVQAKVSADIDVAGIKIKATNLSFSYDSTGAVTGLRISTPSTSENNPALKVVIPSGQAGKADTVITIPSLDVSAGIRITNGALESFSLDCSGAFSFKDLRLKNVQASIRYSTVDDSVITVQGVAEVELAGFGITATIGRRGADNSFISPGIKLVNGAIDTVDISISGNVRLGNGFTMAVADAGVTYVTNGSYRDLQENSQNGPVWGIYGRLMPLGWKFAPPLLAFGTKATPGILIYAGELLHNDPINIDFSSRFYNWGIDGMASLTPIAADTYVESNGTPGWQQGETLLVDQNHNGTGDASYFRIEMKARLRVPFLGSLFAAMKFDTSGGLDSISVSIPTHFKIPGTPLIVTALGGSVENLNNPSQLSISADIGMSLPGTDMLTSALDKIDEAYENYLDFQVFGRTDLGVKLPDLPSLPTLASAHFTGKIAYSPGKLSIIGDAWLFALKNNYSGTDTFKQADGDWSGLVHATGKVVLDWGHSRYYASLETTALGGLFHSNTLLGMDFANNIYVAQAGATIDVENTIMDFAPLNWVTPLGANFIIVISPTQKDVGGWVEVAGRPFGAGYNFIDNDVELWGKTKVKKLKKIAESIVTDTGGAIPVNERRYNTEFEFNYTVDDIEGAGGLPLTGTNSITLSSSFLAIDGLSYERTTTETRKFPNFLEPNRDVSKLSALEQGAYYQNKSTIDTRFARDSSKNSATASRYTIMPARYFEEPTDTPGIRKGTITVTIYPFQLTSGTDYDPNTGKLTPKGEYKVSLNSYKTFDKSYFASGSLANITLKSNTPAIIINDKNAANLLKTEIPAPIPNGDPVTPTWLKISNKNYSIAPGFAIKYQRKDLVINPDTGESTETTKLVEITPQPEMSVQKNVSISAPFAETTTKAFDNHANTTTFTANAADPDSIVGQQTTVSLLFASQAEAAARRWQAVVSGPETACAGGFQSSATLFQDESISTSEQIAGNVIISSELIPLLGHNALKFKLETGPTTRPGQPVLYLTTENNVTVVRTGIVNSWGFNYGAASFEEMVVATITPNGSNSQVVIPLNKLKPARIAKATVLLQRTQNQVPLTDGSAFTVSLVNPAAAGSNNDLAVFKVVDHITNGVLPPLPAGQPDISQFVIDPLPAGVLRQVNVHLATASESEIKSDRWLFKTLNDAMRPVNVTALNDKGNQLPTPIGSDRISLFKSVQGNAPLASLSLKASLSNLAQYSGTIRWEEDRLSSVPQFGFISISDGINPAQFSNPFAYTPTPALTGSVMLATDNDGKAPLANMLAFVDANGNGKRDTGETFNITDSQGLFSFYNLADGQKASIIVELPGGAQFRSHGAGADLSDPVKQVTVGQGTAPEFLLDNLGSIYRGRVVIDANGNAKVDATDPGAGNVNLRLSITNGSQNKQLNTISDNTGLYLFEIPAGYRSVGRPQVASSRPELGIFVPEVTLTNPTGITIPGNSATQPKLVEDDIIASKVLTITLDGLGIDDLKTFFGQMPAAFLKLRTGEFNAVSIRMFGFKLLIDSFQFYAPNTEGVKGLQYASGWAFFGDRGNGQQNQVRFTLGDNRTGGLALKNGRLQGFQLSLQGSIRVAGVDVEVTGLSARFNAGQNPDGSDGFFQLVGQATASYQDNELALALTGDGLIVDAGGIRTFNGTLTGSIPVAGQKVELGTLGMTYSRAESCLTFTGSSKWTMAGDKRDGNYFGLDDIELKIGLGGDPAKGAGVRSLSANLAAGFRIEGIDFDVSRLSFAWLPSSDSFSISGKTSITNSDKSIDLTAELPGDGLVFSSAGVVANANVNGAVKLGSSGYTVSVTDSGLTYSDRKLGFQVNGTLLTSVQAAGAKVPRQELVAMSGSAYFAGGKLSSLEGKAGGKVALTGATADLRDITVGYDGSTRAVTLSGQADLSLDETAGESKGQRVLGISGSLSLGDYALQSLSAKVSDGQWNPTEWLGITLTGLSVSYDRSLGRFGLSGGCDMKVNGDKVGISLPGDGLLWENGSFRSFNAGLTGSITLQGSQGGARPSYLEATNASLGYDRTAKRITLGGSFKGVFGPSAGGQVTIGPAGIVVDAGGVQSFDASVTAIANFGEEFEDKDGDFTYNPARDGKYTDSNGNGKYDFGFGIRFQEVGLTYTRGQTGFTRTIGIKGSAVAAFSPEFLTSTTGKGLGAAISIPDGITFTDGKLVDFSFSIAAGFDVKGLKLTQASLGGRWLSSTREVAAWGSGGLTLDGKVKGVDLGTSANPGIRVVGGVLNQVNAAITGSISLADVSVSLAGAGLSYKAADNGIGGTWGIFGTASLKIGATVTTSLGTRDNPGIKIDTSAPDNQRLALNDVALNISPFAVGGISLQETHLAFNRSGESFSASITTGVTFNGWGLGGRMVVRNGLISEITVRADGSIPIPGTPIIISMLSGSITNIDTLDFAQITLTARVGMDIGGTVTVNLPGKSDLLDLVNGDYSALHVEGTASISGGGLTMIADAYLGAKATGTGLQQAWKGYLGEGTANLNLNWARNSYSAGVRLDLAGGLFRVTGTMNLGNSKGLVLQATAAMRVPDKLPIIGGVSLASANFLLQILPDQKALAIAYGEIFPFGEKGVKCDFLTGQIDSVDASEISKIVAAAGASRPGSPAGDPKGKLNSQEQVDTGYSTLSAAFTLSRSAPSAGGNNYSGQSQPVPETEVQSGTYRVWFRVNSAGDKAAYNTWKNRLQLTAAPVAGVTFSPGAMEFDPATGIGSIALTVTPLAGQYLPRGMVLSAVLSSPVPLTRNGGDPSDPLEAASEWTPARSYTGSVPAIGTDENGVVIPGLNVGRAKYLVTFKPDIAAGETLPADWLESIRVYASPIAGTTIQVDRPTYDAVNKVGTVLVTYFPIAIPRVSTRIFSIIHEPTNPADFINKGVVPEFSIRSKVPLAGFKEDLGGSNSPDVSASWWGLPHKIEAPEIPSVIGSSLRTTTVTGKTDDPRITNLNVSLFYSQDSAGAQRFPITLADGQSAVVLPVLVRPDGSWSATFLWDPSRLPEGDLWLGGWVSDSGPIPPVMSKLSRFSIQHNITGHVTSVFAGADASLGEVERPMSGVRVFVDLDGDKNQGASEPATTTGEDGTYLLDAPSQFSQSTVIFRVPENFAAKAGSSLEQVVDLSDGQAHADLRLVPAVDIIRGQVRVAGRLGQPVAGLTVRAQAPDGSAFTVDTNQSGYYQFPAYQTGTYSIIPDFAGATWNDFEIRPMPDSAPVLVAVDARRYVHDLGVLRVQSVGVVSKVSGDLANSLPGLMHSAEEGFVSRIEFDSSLRGQTVRLEGSVPTQTPRHLRWTPENQGWEHYPAAVAVLPNGSPEDTYQYGPTAFRVADDLEIDGGSLGITLQGDGASRAFIVRAGGSLKLSNITLAGFSAIGTEGSGGTSAGPNFAGGGGGGGAGLGGAILNRGRLELNGVVFANNMAQGGAGGSVRLPGASRISSSLNLGGDTGGAAGSRQGATGGAGGGPLGGQPGTSSSAAFSYTLAGKSDILSATTTFAAAGGGGSGAGGAIYNDLGATTIVIGNSQFLNNRASGGVGGTSTRVVTNPANAQFGDGALTTAIESLADGPNVNGTAGSGLGGAIYNAGGVVIITGSFFEGNSSTDAGAAVYGIGGRLGLNGTTIRSNSSPADGGLRFNPGDLADATLQLSDTVISSKTGVPPAAVVTGGTVVGTNNVISSRLGIPARHAVGEVVVARPASPVTGTPYVPPGESPVFPVGLPVSMQTSAISPLVGAFRPFRIQISIADTVEGRIPSGRVVLARNGAEVATVALPTTGSITITAPGMPAGTYTYQVYYEGDALFAGRVATVVARSGTRGEWLASKLFQVNLARQGSVTEVRRWGARIDAGLGLQDAVRLFRTSTTAARRAVTEAYQDLLSRVPDTVGLRNWVAFLQTGKTEAQMRASIMALPAYKARHTNTQAIDEVYTSLLGKPADDFAKAYWQTKFRSGATAQTVTTAVESSLERRTKIVDSLYSAINGVQPSLAASLGLAATFSSGSAIDSVEARLLDAAEKAR